MPMPSFSLALVRLVVPFLLVRFTISKHYTRNEIEEGTSSLLNDYLGMEERIIRGEPADPDRYPYMVGLTTRNKLQCGGTMIAPDIILTAAHCSKAVGAAEIGRYNISDPSEKYETCILEQVVAHPLVLQQTATDVDPYDFAIMKIYDTSKLASTFIELNTDPSIPSKEGQEMYVMGWGKPTVNGTEIRSDVLREAEVFYIPNEVCRNISSESPMVNLSQKIVDVNLCAADFKEGDDSCTGDSGGPIILRGSNASTDVQLGVTSYGFGCADPKLPGIYARVSYVEDWIADLVCQLSLDPPSQYNCTNTVPKPDLSGEKINVTFQFSLDNFFPNETGWIVQGLVEDRLVTYHHAPIGSYANATTGVASTTISLPNDREYVFTIFDSFGDGNVAAAVSVGNTSILSTPFLEGGYSASYDLVVGEPKSSSPTKTPANPTAAPTTTPPFITIVITFDSFPEETGWLVEALLKSGEVEVLEQVYTYNDTSASSVTEVVNLLSTTPMTYRVVIMDNEADGICCDGSVDGSYTVYFGSPEDEVVLGKGGESFWEESYFFTAEGNGTVKNETAPPKSPTTTPPPKAPPQPTPFAPIPAPIGPTSAAAAISIGSALLCIMTMQILF